MKKVPSYPWEPLARKFVAEFLGTFTLALVIQVISFGTANYPGAFQALYVPFLAGLTLAFLVAVLGGVSGANFNPAVSIGLFAVRKLTAIQLAVYLVAQVAGAFAALQGVKYLVGAAEPLTAQATSYVWWGESFGAFVLVLGIMATIQGRLKPAAAAPVIGAGLAIGVALSQLSSGGVLNPAIALSLGVRSLPYLLAPIIGACVAAVLYTYVLSEAPVAVGEEA